jgi:membrane protein required for colicin V production
MWLNWLALGLLAVFVGLGAVRGGFRAGMGLLALGVGYAAGVFGAAALAPRVASATGVPELLAIPLAGSLLFVAGFGGVSLLAWWLRRRGVGEGPFSARERFLGAVFGGIRGALVVLLVSILAHWVDALRVVGDGAPLPPVADSFTGRVTADVVESGLSAALADSGAAGRVAARMAAQPARSLEDFQAVVDHPLVTGLQEDPLFWTYVEHENVDGALDRPVALRLLNDVELRARLVGLGLASEAAAQDPTVLRSELADVLREVGPRVRSLREDPALQELMQDPEVVAAVQTGNTIALLGHPGFRALVERAASRPVAETSQN